LKIAAVYVLILRFPISIFEFRVSIFELQKAELKLGSLGHHIFAPRRIPHHIDFDTLDAGKHGNLVFDFSRE
jgi:hypothetical protein